MAEVPPYREKVFSRKYSKALRWISLENWKTRAAQNRVLCYTVFKNKKNRAVEGQYFMADVHVSQVLIYQNTCIKCAKMCKNVEKHAKICKNVHHKFFLDPIQKRVSSRPVQLKLEAVQLKAFYCLNFYCIHSTNNRSPSCVLNGCKSKKKHSFWIHIFIAPLSYFW